MKTADQAVAEVAVQGDWVGIEAAAYHLPGPRLSVDAWMSAAGYADSQVASVRRHGHQNFHLGDEYSALELAMAAVDRLFQSHPEIDRRRIGGIIYCCSTQHTLPPAPYSAPAAIQHAFGLHSPLCFSISQLNCVSVIAAFKAAQALLLSGQVRDAILVVSADRESSTAYRVNGDCTLINSDGASAALVTTGCRRNRIGAVYIRNYSELNGGIAGEEFLKNRFRMRILEWSAAHDAIAAAIKGSTDSADHFVRLLPNNMSLQGWHGVARRLGRSADFVFGSNVAEKAHAFCADAVINLLDSSSLDLVSGEAVIVAGQSNNGAFGAFTVHGHRGPAQMPQPQ